jgi:single-stranded DNA-binding protein
VEWTPVCVLRLACVAKRVPGGSRGGSSGFNVVVLGPTARRIAPYLHRGRRVVVQGRLEMERWEVGEGPEREAVCVVADSVHFAGNAPRRAEVRTFVKPANAGAHARGAFAAVGFSEEMWC